MSNKHYAGRVELAMREYRSKKEKMYEGRKVSFFSGGYEREVAILSNVAEKYNVSFDFLMNICGTRMTQFNFNRRK